MGGKHRLRDDDNEPTEQIPAVKAAKQKLGVSTWKRKDPAAPAPIPLTKQLRKKRDPKNK